MSILDQRAAVKVDSQARFQAAVALARAGRLDDAIDVYCTLLDAHPGLLEARANLGFALLALHRYAEAVSHFSILLETRPDAMPVRVGLAYALQKQSDWAGAIQHYQQAVALEPNHVQVLLGLGVCLRSQGRLDEACAKFEQAITADPECVEGYHLLSTLKRFDADDPILRQCEALAPRVAALPLLKQARYGFALGKMREDVGRFDDAFTAYAAGNRARASLFVLDESDEDAWLQRTCAAFGAKRLSERAIGNTDDRRVPVFVIGMPRSGTSLVEQILASHPRVHGAGEIADLREVMQEYAGSLAGWPDNMLALSNDTLHHMGIAYLERVFRTAPQATHVINKTPLNYRYVGLIRLILPHARIIHLVRDPMDVCFSCFTRLFDGDNLAYTYDLETLGRYYVRYARLMRHWRQVVPDALLDLHYEVLVRDTESEVRRMLDYLGLEWNARCLEFHRNNRVVETASRAQVRQPIYRSSIERWRHFETHLQPLGKLVDAWRMPKAD